MAKFAVEYEIHLGDIVRFEKSDGTSQQGVVQDVSQIPDIFVEGFDGGEYKRWRLGIDSLEVLYSKGDLSGKSTRVEIGSKEPVEFVHKGDVGTKEFDELIYTDIERKVMKNIK